jgi:Flp pilus assembly protein CpaB
LDDGMSLFPWALVFVGLALVAAAVAGLIGWSLWRKARAVAAEAGALADALARIPTVGTPSRETADPVRASSNSV